MRRLTGGRLSFMLFERLGLSELARGNPTPRPQQGHLRARALCKEVHVARAYVKINVAAGKEREVRDRLRKRTEVASADLTSGDQDIIALVQADTFDELLDLTLNQLRTIEGVTGTVTNLIVDKDEDH